MDAWTDLEGGLDGSQELCRSDGGGTRAQDDPWDETVRVEGRWIRCTRQKEGRRQAVDTEDVRMCGEEVDPKEENGGGTGARAHAGR